MQKILTVIEYSEIKLAIECSQTVFINLYIQILRLMRKFQVKNSWHCPFKICGDFKGNVWGFCQLLQRGSQPKWLQVPVRAWSQNTDFARQSINILKISNKDIFWLWANLKNDSGPKSRFYVKWTMDMHKKRKKIKKNILNAFLEKFN